MGLTRLFLVRIVYGYLGRLFYFLREFYRDMYVLLFLAENLQGYYGFIMLFVAWIVEGYVQYQYVLLFIAENLQGYYGFIMLFVAWIV